MELSEMESRTPPRTVLLKRRIFVMVGLLSLVLIVLGVYSAVRLAESNRWLGESLAEARVLVDAVDAARTAQVHFKKQVQEWKDVLLRGSDPALYEKHFAAFQEEEDDVRASVGRLKGLLAELGIPIGLADEFLLAHASLGRQYREALAAYGPEKPESGFEVDRRVRGIDREATDRIDAIVKDMETRWDARIEAYAETSVAEFGKQRQFSESVVFLVACGLILGIFFASAIVRQLRAV